MKRKTKTSISNPQPEQNPGSWEFRDQTPGNPFEVPAGYFDELPGKIMERCVSGQGPEMAVHRRSLVYRISLAAAALALLVVAGYLVSRQVSRNQPAGTDILGGLPEISDSMLKVEDYDESTLVDFLPFDSSGMYAVDVSPVGDHLPAIMPEEASQLITEQEYTTDELMDFLAEEEANQIQI